ncbi:uncharacterized protein LOC141906249 [Tubulanus polymorphus]|uniref:uncharacterized protein LOC141906249 n=1 Tax=Tubulanus polymorphus TaxID=672921 RepID=UPI003DA28260
MERPAMSLKEKVMFRRIQMDRQSPIGTLKGTFRRHLIKVARYPTREERSAITRAICGIYCMIACVFGVVFPISDAITGTDTVHYYYTEIFHLYMFSVAIAALGFIFIDLLRKIGTDESVFDADCVEMVRSVSIHSDRFLSFAEKAETLKR